MAAVNPDLPEDKETRLSRSVLDLALSIAHLEGGDLHIAHTWSLLGESILRSPRVRTEPEEMDQLLAKSREQARAHLTTLLEGTDFMGMQYKLHLVKNQEPAMGIAQLAARCRVDTVVMGMMGRGGLTGLLVGNSAEELLQEVNCSVMTVKLSDSPLSSRLRAA